MMDSTSGDVQQFASLREHGGRSPDQLSNDSGMTVPALG